LSLHDRLLTCRHLLGDSFTRLKQNLCAALTTDSTTKNNCFIILHAQNTAALQSNVFLTGLRQLLVTSKQLVSLGQAESSPTKTIAKVNFGLHSY